MTAEEVFDDLSKKYGKDFNWYMLPFTNKTFVAELKKEIGENNLWMTFMKDLMKNVV